MATGPSPDSELSFELRLASPSGDVLLETRRTSTAVELRGVLLSLAYRLIDEPVSSIGVCLLKESRLTDERVKHELERLREALNPRLSSRVFLVGVKEGRLQGELPPGQESLLPQMIEWAQRESASPASRVTQQDVKMAVLTRWFTTSGRLGVADMQRATGASMPTVIAAFRALQEDGLIYAHGNGWRLVDEFSWDNAQRIVRARVNLRRTYRYKDPTGHARSPLAMAEKLRKLQSKGERLDVDLGGVLGAQQYYPDLDITGAPRLDLCVYDGDLNVVLQIDAGLDATKDLEDKAVLVIHMTRDPRRAPREPGELHAASVIDCLADLLEIGLQAEAYDFWHAMTRRRKAVVGQQETAG